MGKVCSKEGLHARHPAFPDDAQRLLTVAGAVSRQVSVQPEVSFSAPEIRPPHSVLKETIQDLSKTHKFYVHLHGLKARNLRLRNPEAHTFCVVNWDDFAFERRTRKVCGGINPRWGDAMQFYYSVPTLALLRSKSVTLQVYEESGSKSRIVGSTTVNLMTIAGGPIHHDLSLYEPLRSTTSSRSASDVGRLIFDLRMAQDCQLIISPIEVLVHLRESLDALDQLEVEGVGTSRPGTPLATQALSRTVSMTSVEEKISPAELQPAVSRTETGERRPRPHRREATEEEEIVETVLQDMATGGHSESDAIGPFLAEWQLAFIPTGVDNPVEFCSSFSPISDQPYWNAVDHTIINELMATDNVPPVEETPKLANGAVPHGPKSQLRHVPISASTARKSPDQTMPPQPAPSAYTNGPIAPAVLVHSMSAPHVDHIDPQTTYRKLAAICRQGRLIREMLYDDLPTIQLETTGDFLRQNHLKLRLYAKRLGFQAPKFYGEAWLPFFKIYDVDVVEQMHQNFSDAYFHEKLWYEGKCIGHIEGVIAFQNNPMIRQMVAGVNTDSGFMRISPPVLGSEYKSVKFVFRSQDVVPEEITRISQLHQALLDMLFSKTQHGASEAGLLALSQASQQPRGTRTKVPFWKRKSKFPMDAAGLQPPPSPRGKGGPAEVIQVAQQEFHSACDQVLQLLRVSHVETRRSFLYRNPHALLVGQRVFLNLADHVLEFADYVPWQYRSTYSAILHQTLRRGELDIGSCLPEPPSEVAHLSLDQRHALHSAARRLRHIPNDSSRPSPHDATPRSQSPRIVPSASSLSSAPPLPPEIECMVRTLSHDAMESLHLYSKRLKLCRQYFLVLHRVLSYCLAKLCGDCVFEGQRKYLAIFLCICYFRLPSFRSEFLAALLTAEERDMGVPEWRGTEYELNAATLAQLDTWQPGFEHRLLLDWSPLHQTLKYFGEEALNESLSTLPPIPEDWRRAWCERGPSFFSFLEHWAKHVYQAIPQKKTLRWHMLPGYATLTKAMLIEMKQRDVTKYPDALLNCTGAMLANERLLSVFIKVLFLKTSVFDASAVFATLNYVDYWVQVLTLREQPLPPNFDLQFLKRGLDIVLGSDIGLCTAKGIWFIYKNLPVFKEGQLRVFVLDLMLEKYFFTYVRSCATQHYPAAACS